MHRKWLGSYPEQWTWRSRRDVLLEEPAPWLFITVSKESDTGG
jgi:hypothetical protein